MIRKSKIDILNKLFFLRKMKRKTYKTVEHNRACFFNFVIKKIKLIFNQEFHGGWTMLFSCSAHHVDAVVHMKDDERQMVRSSFRENLS